MHRAWSCSLRQGFRTIQLVAAICAIEAGVVPESLHDLTHAQFFAAIGNCIPVPIIGTIMVPVFRAWIQIG
eukprot:1108199-Lingulodinium_polyedra.AAC.1